MSELPPLPKGFTLDAGSQDMPPLPTGFTLDAPPENSLGGAAKAVGSGLANAGIGLAGMSGDLRQLSASGLNYIGNKVGLGNVGDAYSSIAKYAVPGLGGPTSDQIRNAIESKTGSLDYQPQTKLEGYLKTGAEFAPALIGGPESLATKLATRVAAPAIASETAGQLTAGTQAEPYARAAGALVGGAGASKLANIATASKAAIPEVADLKASADAAYKHPDIANVTIKPQVVKNLATDIDASLLSNKVDKFVAPTVTGIIDRLETPRFGSAHTIDDLDLARQALRDVPHNEARAAGIARGEIDKFLSGKGILTQSDLLSGNAAAANAKLLEARGDYAAMKRTKDVEDALARAEINNGTAHSGANLENATRQQLKPILKQKLGIAQGRGFQDYTPEEIAALKKAVVGTHTGNTIRALGKYLGGGGGLGGLAAGVTGASAAHEAGADPGTAIAAGFAAALAGKGLNRLGVRLATNRANQVSELLRSRSPLAQKLAAVQQLAGRPQPTNPLVQGLLQAVLARQGFLSGQQQPYQLAQPVR